MNTQEAARTDSGCGGCPARGGSPVIWVPVSTPAGQWRMTPVSGVPRSPPGRRHRSACDLRNTRLGKEAHEPLFPFKVISDVSIHEAFLDPGLDGALGPRPGRDPLPHDAAAGVRVLGLATGPLRTELRGPAPNADAPQGHLALRSWAPWLLQPHLGQKSTPLAGLPT